DGDVAGDNREEAEEEEEEDEWEFEDEDAADVVPGDGLDGGGFVLNGAAWGQTALELAQEVLAGSKYGGEFELYGFKVYPERNWIRVRLDKLTDVYGSPMVEDIDSFLREFNALVIAAGERGELPQDIQIEVSSPGAERVVKVPDDLIRFKELPMYVHYRLPGEADSAEDTKEANKGDIGVGGSTSTSGGSTIPSGGKTSEEILSLVEVDEERVTVWRVADFHPTLIFTQEGSKEQLEYLHRELKAYEWFGSKSQDAPGEEYSAIFYNRDQVEVMESGNFWLSETPEVCGSTSWGASTPAVVTWVKFRVRGLQPPGFAFQAYNVRMKTGSSSARAKGALLLWQHISSVPPSIPALMCANFNKNKGSATARFFLGSWKLNGIEGDFKDVLSIARKKINTGHIYSHHRFQ
ncbi:unnamed protein product, partial [Closterium sp. Naga37s-1]